MCWNICKFSTIFIPSIIAQVHWHAPDTWNLSFYCMHPTFHPVKGIEISKCNREESNEMEIVQYLKKGCTHIHIWNYITCAIRIHYDHNKKKMFFELLLAFPSGCFFFSSFSMAARDGCLLSLQIASTRPESSPKSTCLALVYIERAQNATRKQAYRHIKYIRKGEIKKKKKFILSFVFRQFLYIKSTINTIQSAHFI